MNANELNARRSEYLKNIDPRAEIKIVSYGSLIRGGRHGSCYCCRYHQFMSDAERAAEITHLYESGAQVVATQEADVRWQTYTTIVCETCARFAQKGN